MKMSRKMIVALFVFVLILSSLACKVTMTNSPTGEDIVLGGATVAATTPTVAVAPTASESPLQPVVSTVNVQAGIYVIDENSCQICDNWGNPVIEPETCFSFSLYAECSTKCFDSYTVASPTEVAPMPIDLYESVYQSAAPKGIYVFVRGGNEMCQEWTDEWGNDRTMSEGPMSCVPGGTERESWVSCSPNCVGEIPQIVSEWREKYKVTTYPGWWEEFFGAEEAQPPVEVFVIATETQPPPPIEAIASPTPSEVAPADEKSPEATPATPFSPRLTGSPLIAIGVIVLFIIVYTLIRVNSAGHLSVGGISVSPFKSLFVVALIAAVGLMVGLSDLKNFWPVGLSSGSTLVIILFVVGIVVTFGNSVHGGAGIKVGTVPDLEAMKIVSWIVAIILVVLLILGFVTSFK